MSIVIAYKQNDVVYLGASVQSHVDAPVNQILASKHKILKMDNGLLVGVSAENLERQTIFANSEMFTLDKHGKLTRKHVVCKILPKLMEVLDKAGLVKKHKDNRPYVNAEIVLAHKGVLYEIDMMFTVIRHVQHCAVGPSSLCTMAILNNFSKDVDVNKQIVKALDATAAHFTNVKRPYILIDTANMSYQLIKEED